MAGTDEGLRQSALRGSPAPPPVEDYAARIFFSLTDREGELRFEHFEVDAPACRPYRESLERLLLTGALARIDVTEVCSDPGLRACPALPAVAATIRDLQKVFCTPSGRFPAR
jgi:hypothetical protein